MARTMSTQSRAANDSRELHPHKGCELPLRPAFDLEYQTRGVSTENPRCRVPEPKNKCNEFRRPAKSLKRESAENQQLLAETHRADWELESSESDNNSSESDNSSETDSCFESDSDQDTDSEADEDASLDGDVLSGRISLAPDHEYQDIRQDLARWVSDRFCAWKATVRYGIPPGYRQTSRKRARGSIQKPQMIYVHEEDPDDPGVVTVSRIDGYFHLACPFYQHDPVQHKQCLTHDLQSIEDVIVHLQRHHITPAYCPICLTTFASVLERNTHLRPRSCKAKPFVRVSGVDERPLSKIIKHDDIYVREDIRWLRIFSRAVHNGERGKSPYHTDGAGLEISLLRDYLAGDGHDFVAQYLRSRGMIKGRPDENAMTALHFLTMEDLIKKIISCDGEGGAGEQRL